MTRTLQNKGVLLVASIVAVGCGLQQPVRQVSGKVTYNGAPIKEGIISFVPIDGTSGPSIGGEIKDGHYSVSAKVGPLAVGNYRVEIVSAIKRNRTAPNPFNPTGAPVDLYENDIPEAYNSESALKITILKDSKADVFDFDLQPPAGARQPRR